MAYTPSSSGQMGSWSTTDASSLIVPANVYREKLVVQMRSSNLCSLAWDNGLEAGVAVFTQGVQLRIAGSVIIVTGALARSAVYGICDTGLTASGGYQEHLGVCD
jgi:hypothetical protein